MAKVGEHAIFIGISLITSQTYGDLGITKNIDEGPGSLDLHVVEQASRFVVANKVLHKPPELDEDRL